MSDRRKEAEEKMEKAIFISNDAWLSVFELLKPSQLGLGIALVSHQFDAMIDEHFKTRRWALKSLEIWRKNGTTEMAIRNSTKELIGGYQMKMVHLFEGKKQLPIPEVQLPRKVSGFKCIIISYIDRNAIDFLHRLSRLFTACPINLDIDTNSDRILGLIVHNIWPLLGKNLRGVQLSFDVFHRLRQFVPSVLNDCPSLSVVHVYEADLFPEFLADDSATASDGQAMAKWLFTPLPNNVPKVLRYQLKKDDGNLASAIEAFKAAFASASSPVNFIVVLWFPESFADSVVLFDLTNELTREQLALKRTVFSTRFLLIRSPIARDANKWAKWEEEAIDWAIYYRRNRIDIEIYNEANIGDGLLDVTPGPSDRQK